MSATKTTSAGALLRTVPTSARSARDDEGVHASDESVEPRVSSRRLILGIQVAVLVVGVALFRWAQIWGSRVEKKEPRIKLGAPPLVGEWDWRGGVSLLPAMLLALVTVFVFPRWLRERSLTAVILAASIAAAVFTFVLAASDGLTEMLVPVNHPTEYWSNVVDLPPAGDFVWTFDNINVTQLYSVHIKGHPPGFVLLLKALRHIGLGSVWVAASLSYLGAGFVVGAVLTTARTMCDEHVVRRAAPFLVVAPYAVWAGTSADAFFAAIAAWGVACVALAVRKTTRLRSAAAFGVCSGALLCAALFLTYGAATFLCLPALVWLIGPRSSWRHRVVVAFAASAAAGAITFAFWAAGFWWFDGLEVTKTLYWWGSAHFRTWTLFYLVNATVAMVALGPAVVGSFVTLRDKRVAILVLGAFAGMAIAYFSQYSKGETERIWLLFYPWMVLSVSSLRRPRAWLAVHACAPLLLQAWLVSKW